MDTIERHSCWDHTYEDCAVVVLSARLAALTAALEQVRYHRKYECPCMDDRIEDVIDAALDAGGA